MTKVQYTMSPDEVARWQGNPMSVIYARTIARNDPATRPISQWRCIKCGVACYAGSEYCRPCWDAKQLVQAGRADAEREKRRQAMQVYHAAIKARGPKVYTRTQPPKPDVDLEAVIDVAWQERPHLTRDAVAILVQRKVKA